ncbi:ATP-binding protein, partial [Bacteroidota bacterium]
MRKLFDKLHSKPKISVKPADTSVFHSQSIFDAIGDVVWILDKDQRILQANLATKSLFNVEPNSVIGHHCWNIVHKTSTPIPDCPILRMHESLERETMEMQVGEKWYQVTVDPLINGMKELEGAIHVIRDITEIHKRDEILIESKYRYADLINNAPFGAHLYELEEDGRLVFTGANPAADRILGVTHDQFIGKTIEEAFPPLIDTEIPEKYRRAASTGVSYSTEQISYSDDFGISGAYDVKAFQTAENQMVAFFFDITEQKKYAEELLKAKEKAEESDRLKTAFLANMSHEIRTPMNGIIGLSSMMEEPDIPEEERLRFLRIIRENSFQLLHIINDLIDISKIEAGQVDLNETAICLNALLDSLYEFYLPLAEKAEITLSIVKGVESLDCCILTDDVKVRQILENLISNALKFSKKGSVEVGYSIKPDAVELYVKDSGIGISPDQKEIIFDRFRQAELSISQQFGGTGLGLSISKSFVEHLRGRIWFDSTPGAGTT